jgi:hypothetical protein
MGLSVARARILLRHYLNFARIITASCLFHRILATSFLLIVHVRSAKQARSCLRSGQRCPNVGLAASEDSGRTVNVQQHTTFASLFVADILGGVVSGHEYRLQCHVGYTTKIIRYDSVFAFKLSGSAHILRYLHSYRGDG